MTPDEIKAARHSLRMSVAEFADWLGLEGPRGRDLIRDWEKGKKPITGPAARAIQTACDPLYRLGQMIGRAIPPGAIQIGEWHKVETTMLPDPSGEIELDGTRYRIGEIKIKRA